MNTHLDKLAKLIRYFILVSTTKAGSGHPTSSLSAVELLTALMFGGFFNYDVKQPENPANDRLIFSKGHASPLLYALFAAANAVSEEELLTLRKLGSRLQGHATLDFPFAEAATGSLGQGLSIGLGMALNAKLEKSGYRTFVLIGDSEMAEGANWEALELAAHYKLDNLVGILDVNRLGQRGETMLGRDLEAYQKQIFAFGWKTIVVKDGHNFEEIAKAYSSAINSSGTASGKPAMIIANTIKGKGVPFLEDKDGWHGKALSQEQLEKALEELGEVDKSVRGELIKPAENFKFQISNFKTNPNFKFQISNYNSGTKVATRKAYGAALLKIGVDPRVVVLDAEVSNSTFSDLFKQKYPERFFEMYIAEQNMVGATLGFSLRGKIPFVSTFAAFLTRAHDQIRMCQYNKANIKFCGSHAGVSIGEDGASQMGLEELSMFRSVLGSVVLYPCDAVSTEKLVFESARHDGIVYIQTTRKDTPIIYKKDDEFPIGGSKTLHSSKNDLVTVIGAGITVHEALAAHEELKKENFNIRVIDLYSIKPLDIEALQQAAAETKALITVEDNFPEGGIGEAIAAALAAMPDGKCKIINLAVRKMPMSGKPVELLEYEEISAKHIIKTIKSIISNG
ncbi:transketolase [bacterium]|nr:MAG: transketolase [bacterium]